jgi:hypothetical protein
MLRSLGIFAGCTRLVYLSFTRIKNVILRWSPIVNPPSCLVAKHTLRRQETHVDWVSSCKMFGLTLDSIMTQIFYSMNPLSMSSRLKTPLLFQHERNNPLQDDVSVSSTEIIVLHAISSMFLVGRPDVGTCGVRRSPTLAAKNPAGTSIYLAGLL